MKSKKKLIILIIVANTLFLLTLFYEFYYKKASFDTSIKANIATEKIVKVATDVGTWHWNNKEIDFYRKHSVNLNKNQIAEFCTIINASHAKYIENRRPDYWVDINLETVDKENILITLKQSKTDGFFFEINHDNAFEGKTLADYIMNHTLLNK